MLKSGLLREATSLDVGCFGLEIARVDNNALLRKLEVAFQLDVSLGDQLEL